MRNAMKLGSSQDAMLMTEDDFMRLGTLGAVGGALLALVLVLF